MELTQQGLGKLLGVQSNVVSGRMPARNSKGVLPLSWLYALCEVLEVPLAELAGGDWRETSPVVRRRRGRVAGGSGNAAGWLLDTLRQAVRASKTGRVDLPGVTSVAIVARHGRDNVEVTLPTGVLSVPLPTQGASN